MTQSPKSPSAMIDDRIASLGDWRAPALARVRALIKEEDPDVVEAWKWMGTPVWEHAGILCTGESYKTAVKLTFAKGAFLRDPKKLFNSSLEGNMRRAIDIHEGDELDAKAFKQLIREAIELNLMKPAKSAKSAKTTAAKPSKPAKKPAKPAKKPAKHR